MTQLYKAVHELAAAGPLSADSLPGIGSMLVALLAAYFTWNATRQQNATANRDGAVKGYDMLAEDLRGDLAVCRTALRERDVEVVVLKRANAELTYRNDELERENAALRRQAGGGKA